MIKNAQIGVRPIYTSRLNCPPFALPQATIENRITSLFSTIYENLNLKFKSESILLYGIHHERVIQW